MKWFYRCTNCGAWLSVDWEHKDNCYICRFCNSQHFPPSPEEQHDAFVNDRKPPKAMEEYVYLIKGRKCTVPGCSAKAELLDHRIPWKSNERGTSVENLFPMCATHNASKEDKNYQAWLIEVYVHHLK